MLPALSDLSTTGKAPLALCSTTSSRHGWRKSFAWIRRLTSTPQIQDELHSSASLLLLLLVRNHRSFLLKTPLQPQQGWLFISTLSGVERKRNSLLKLMEMWLPASLSAFSSPQGNKAAGWEGNGSTSKETASATKSWKDVPADERQREEAAHFLVCCTRQEHSGQAKSAP